MKPIEKMLNPASPFDGKKRITHCKKAEFQNRDVKENQSGCEFPLTTKPESLTSADLSRPRSVELREKQVSEMHKPGSCDQFRAELDEIRTKLSNDDFCFEHIEECKKELSSLINERTGFLYFNKISTIPFFIESSEKTQKIKKMFNRCKNDFKALMTINPDDCFDKMLTKVGLIFRLCKHYSLPTPISNIKKLLNNAAISGEFNKSNLSLIEMHHVFFSEHLPVLLLFDLLLDGSFDNTSELFCPVLSNHLKNYKTIRLSDINFGHSPLNIDFESTDHHTQTLWTLFSILGYWDTSDHFYFEYFADALKTQRAIYLIDNDSFIKYLTMRMDTDFYFCDCIKDLTKSPKEFDVPKLNLHLHKLRNISITNFLNPRYETIFALKTFSISNYMNDKHAECLYDHFKKCQQKHYSSTLIDLLHRPPVLQEAEVEQRISEIDTRIINTINENLSEDSKVLFMGLLEDNKQKVGNAAQIRMKKISIMTDIISTLTNIEHSTAKNMIDPVQLILIKQPWKTPYGHIFDEFTMFRAIRITSNRRETGKCPVTGGDLSFEKSSLLLELLSTIEEIPKGIKDKIETLFLMLHTVITEW
ncbi:hypothetical protein [Salinisphaera sp. G21_0]|uniref:hypothetical protein n=1 Tax=Salinisphaera sp. G21_0 TaxID=2821094 RepID=UPI001ADBD8C0|nr:hypothetical protein [Salinisphaera sp. G21_0]MBO9484621.1 hypothetical protein [Salinisphaera sp. G21_0]